MENGSDSRLTECRVGGLIEGLEYQFRVKACNIAGASEASEPTWSAVALDPCDEPTDLSVEDVSTGEVTLSYTAPKYNGGHRLSGYDIEYRKHPGKIWQKSNYTSVQELVYTVKELIDGCTYDFRVIAKNTAGGISKPSVAVVDVEVKEIYIPANVAMDQTLLNGITIRNGQEISLTAKITGKPTPKVTWSHGNDDIKESDFVKVINTHSTTELIIKDSKLKNSGEYTCSVSNHYGTKHIACKVFVLDKPGPVGSIQRQSGRA